MHAVIWILGAVIILEGVVFLIRPDFFAKVISFFARSKMIYLAAVIRVVLGPIFLVYATRCKIPSVIITFGVLMLIGAAGNESIANNSAVINVQGLLKG